MAEEVKKGPEVKNLVLASLFFVFSLAVTFYVGWSSQIGLLFDLMTLASLIILLASISALKESKKKVLRQSESDYFQTRFNSK